MALFVLQRRTIKKDATTVAFHLRNANIALERVENSDRTIGQDVITAGLRRAVNDAIRRGDALLADITKNEQEARP